MEACIQMVNISPGIWKIVDISLGVLKQAYKYVINLFPASTQ